LVEISNRKILVLSRKTIAVPTSADFIEGSNISIGHLGIVASAFDTPGIAGVIAVDRLLGDGVTIDHLNDDVLSTSLI